MADSSSTPYRLVPAHQCDEETLVKVAALLNQQWPRSEAARLASLAKSSDALPMHLVLVNEADNSVVAHSAISRVAHDESGLLIESVVVPASLRGTGLGRRIMSETEAVAVSLGFRRLFLSTKDKQHFYAHLGYLPCEPVSSLGSNAGRLNTAQLGGLLRVFGGGGGSSSSGSNTTSPGVYWLSKELLPAATTTAAAAATS